MIPTDGQQLDERGQWEVGWGLGGFEYYRWQFLLSQERNQPHMFFDDALRASLLLPSLGYRGTTREIRALF